MTPDVTSALQMLSKSVELRSEQKLDAPTLEAIIECQLLFLESHSDEGSENEV